ncbi:MAG: peptidoglycan-binding protein [Candidatus Paceibacterota bacterium]
MTTVTTKAMAKVAAVATGLAMATSMLSLAPMAHAASLTSAQVSSILSLLTSFGADASTIANVQASLTGGTPSTTTTTTTGGTCSFSRNLTVGSQGADVTCLQQALIGGGFSVPAGATGYFGTQTRTAVASWQSSKNIAPAVGYFGSISRAAFNLGGGSTTTTTTGPSAGTGNGLKVSLASDSPNNVALVQGQAIGSLAKFTFANPTSSDIKVTNIGFKRIGVSNDSTLVNVYLYNGAKRLTDSAGVSNSAFNFNDPTGVFTVPAGQTYTVSVLADIAGSTSGQQVGAQLVSVTSTGTLDSSVSFPVNGYTQTVSAATLATVDFNNSTLPSAATVNPQNDYVVWQNTVTIGTRAVKMSSFQLRNVGSIKSTDINNLRLYVDGVQTGSAATISSVDSTVTWDLSAAPLTLQTGGRVVKVVGDIVGGSNSTFQFSLRRASDASMIDTDLNQPVLATANGSSFSARSATSATIAAGTVSSVKANNSPSSSVSLGATNVKWASFELRAAGEDVKVENIDVQANTSLDHGLDNGKVFLNGVQVGSTKDLTDAADVNFTFGSSFILKAGTTAVVDVYADAKTSTGAAFTSGDTAAITLGLGASNGQGQVSLTSINVPTSDVTANTITITSSTATLTKYSGYANTTMIAGTNNAKLGSFTLSTGATEGMNVNTITVTLSTAEAATITDLKLVDNATGAQIGSTKPTAADSNSFSVNFDMPASATKVVNVVANVKSGANAGPWAAFVDGSGTGSATGSSITFGSSSANALQTITIGSAVLTAVSGVSPDNQNVIAGASMVKVGTFDFTAQYSGYTIDKIKVKVLADAATAISSITLKYPDSTGTSVSSSQNVTVSSGAQTHATSTFEGLTFYVPAGTTKKLDVYMNLSAIQADGDSGKSVTAILDYNEGFHATDSSGTADEALAAADLASTDTSGKGTLVVRKSIPTLSAVALDSSTLTAGTNKTIARVKVTADAAGDVSWNKIVFTVSKTAAVTLGATSTIALWQGSNQVAGNFATVAGNLAAQSGLDPWGASSTGGTLAFLPSAEQTILAGESATYELRGTVADGATSGSSSLDVSIATAATSATTGASTATGAATPSFIWSDKSSVATVHSTATSDWTNDYLIKSLPVTVGTLTMAH